MADESDTQKSRAQPTFTSSAQGLYRALNDVYANLDRLRMAIFDRHAPVASAVAGEVVQLLLTNAAALRRMAVQGGRSVHVTLGNVLVRAACHAILDELDVAAVSFGPAQWEGLRELRFTATITTHGLVAAVAGDAGRSSLSTSGDRDVVAVLKAFYRQVGAVALRLADLQADFEHPPQRSTSRIADGISVEWAILGGFVRLHELSDRDEEIRRLWTLPAMRALRCVTAQVIDDGTAYVNRHDPAASALRIQLDRLAARLRRAWRWYS